MREGQTGCHSGTGESGKEPAEQAMTPPALHWGAGMLSGLASLRAREKLWDQQSKGASRSSPRVRWEKVEIAKGG